MVPYMIQIQDRLHTQQKANHSKSKKRGCGQSDGSLTVETAMLLPLIILLVMTFTQWIRFFQIQEQSMRSLNEQVRTVSRYGYLTGDILEEVLLTDLQTLEFPLGITKVKKHFLRQAEMRLFTGRYFQGNEGEGSEGTQEDEIRVYLAETGSVYHTSADCTHLKLSISQTAYKELDMLRNQGGERYRGCQACVKTEISQAEDRVYITQEGNRYHLTINCRGLLRRVTCGTLSEALEQGRRLCRRCAEVKKKREGADAGDCGVMANFLGLGRFAA